MIICKAMYRKEGQENGSLIRVSRVPSVGEIVIVGAEKSGEALRVTEVMHLISGFLNSQQCDTRIE